MIVKTTLQVEVEYEGEKASLVFKKPRLNKMMAEGLALKGLSEIEQFQLSFKQYMGELVHVQGVKDEEGKEYTLEQFKELDLPYDFILAVVVAYKAAAFPRAEDPKKDISTAA